MIKITKRHRASILRGDDCKKKNALFETVISVATSQAYNALKHETTRKAPCYFLLEVEEFLVVFSC